jgi:hypothetical protein
MLLLDLMPDWPVPCAPLPGLQPTPACLPAPCRRFKATEASSRKNDAKSMSSRMARMEDDGKLDEWVAAGGHACRGCCCWGD